MPKAKKKAQELTNAEVFKRLFPKEIRSKIRKIVNPKPRKTPKK